MIATVVDDATVAAETAALDIKAALGMPLVLLVEDDQMVATTTIDVLQDIGFQTHWVATGMAAMTWLLEGGQPALVLSDIMMPGGITGIELAFVMEKQFPRIPILLTTGYADKAELAMWAKKPLLLKPYFIADLQRAMSDAIAHSFNTH